jgi:PAS domain S-box-containing protein
MEICDLQGFVDCLEDAVVVIDENYRVVLANAASSRISGRTADKLLNHHCYAVLHGQPAPCDTQPHGACAIQTVRATGQPARVRHHHPDANGFVHVVEIHASPLPGRERGSALVVEVMREITRQVELERETSQRHREMTVLNQITSAVARSVDPETLAPELVDLMLGALNADGAAIYQCQDGLTIPIAQKGIDFPPVFIEALPDELVKVDGPLVFQDLCSDPRWATTVSPGTAPRSMLCVRLSDQVGRQTLLVLGKSPPHAWPPLEVQIAVMAVQQLEIGLERARLFHALRERACSLEETNLRLRAAEQARRQALRRAITAQEDERKRIAAELHDDTAQGLAALIVGMDTAMAMLEHSPAAAREQLAHVKRSTGAIIEDIDSIIAALRPALLDDLGLLPALRAHAAERLDPLGVEWEFDASCSESILPPAAEMVLFRVMQEAINNVARHARAHRVHITLLLEAGGITAEVSDDGVGFETSERLDPSRRQPSFGLLGMQERLATVDGRLEIQSAPGRGTKLRIHVPFATGGEEP